MHEFLFVFSSVKTNLLKIELSFIEVDKARTYLLTFNMVNCAVFGCNSNNKKIKNKVNTISFFRFPKNKDICSIWIVKCARKDKINIDTARLCCHHFTENQFQRNLRDELLNREIIKKKLKDDAIPVINLPKRNNNLTKSDRQKRQDIKICRQLINNDAL